MAIDARGTGTGGGKTPGSKGSTRGVPNDIMTMGRTPGYNQRGSYVRQPIVEPAKPPKAKSKPAAPKVVPPPPPKGKSIKIADSNLFIGAAQPSPEDQVNLVFQDIGGHELIGIVANDMVNPIFDLNGETSAYQPIQNLSSIAVEYSPQNIMKLQDTDFEYFKSFPISLERFEPEYGTGTDGARMYTDRSGNLVIEFVNLRDDHRVQIEALSYGNVISDTIY